MIDDITSNLNNYLMLFPDEKDDFDLLRKQLAENEDVTDRKNFKGHVTVSGLVLTSGSRLLLIYHNKLEKFLQPGGHIESDKEDESLVAGAVREVAEETGIESISLHSWCVMNKAPIMINTHAIPANPVKNEDAHFHHDFMFLFAAPPVDIVLDTSEVSDFKWVHMPLVINENSMVGHAARKVSLLNLM